jgi:GntR family transcriptional regulator
MATEELRYRVVADDLQGRIKNGELPVGHRLPSEKELALRFGVSRVTVRAALAVLERDGLVLRRAGAGTFVTPPKRIQQDLAVLENLFAQFERRGVQAVRRTLEYEWAEVDPIDASALGFSHGMRLRRLWLAEQRPFAYTESYLHPDLRAVSRTEAEMTPAYAMLEKTGHHAARADFTVHAEKPRPHVARALHLDAETPVLVMQRTSFTRSGEPLERTTCYGRSDVLEFAFTARDTEARAAAPLLRPL